MTSLLQCLASLARVVSVGLPTPVPPHRSWDMITEYPLRLTLISEFSSVETLVDRISSTFCKSRAAKCELLRWTAMIFPPFHPSYRLLAILLLSDTDRNVSALAKQLSGLKLSSLPSRETMMNKISAKFFLGSLDAEVSLKYFGLILVVD